jgi:hypothetical protein
MKLLKAVSILAGKKWVLVALAATMAHTSALAFKDSTRSKKIRDSSFVQSYYHLVDLGLQYGSQYMEYRTYYNDTFFLALRPNEVYTLAPSINYRWLSLSYAFTPEFLELNNDDALRGSTRYRRLSTTLSFDRLTLSGLWSTTQGFYLANMGDVYPNWRPGDKHLIFPNMRVRRFTFSGLYRMNPNFSLKAIQGGEEEQLRSTWTLLPGLNISHFRFEVPEDAPIAGKTELMDNLDVNAMLTIAGTWVFAKHAFLSGMAGPMFGFDHFRSLAFNTNQQLVQTNSVNFSTGFHLGINLGYNNPKWYIGLSNYASTYRHAVSNDERLAKVFNQFTLYGGLRIRPPKYLKKTLDWAEKMVPFLQ